MDPFVSSGEDDNKEGGEHPNDKGDYAEEEILHIGEVTGAIQSKVLVVDTHLRKHEEGEHLISVIFPHKMAGLNLVSGVGHVNLHGSVDSHYFANKSKMSVTSIKHSKQLVSCSSFIAPSSPVLLMLLLDPYSPKQLRGCQHQLFLSLLTDSRFKSRFAVSLGAVAY